MKKKKTVLIDDHDTFRTSLRNLIEKRTDFDVAGQGIDARQGEEVVREVRPDVAIVDLSLPDRSGIQLTGTLRAAVPETEVIIVSMHSKIDYVLNSLRAGARGYVVKESVSGCIAQALEAVSQGEYYLDAALSDEIAPRLIETAESSQISDPAYSNLTAREQEIFRLLAQGHSTSDIAQKLCISTKTVANHRTNILAKMDMHSTADLIRYAAKLGLLDEIG